MFTGIVQAVGRVVSLSGLRLVIDVGAAWPDDPVALGESVAVQGVCLTVVETGEALAFDLSQETLARSTLGRLAEGRLVNLERAMRPSDRLGGHIVQGHVDRVGTVFNIEQRQGWWSFQFDAGQDSRRYLIDKGSIAVDGVSLTVVTPAEDAFSVAVIPFTFQQTTLGKLAVGDNVNIEFDVLAKHVENLLAHRACETTIGRRANARRPIVNLMVR
ncbi:MAG: riboflavin synthase [Armatimonadetes bacterium]|nr:riboflavin synthase [Armatimonadota bacterium]